MCEKLRWIIILSSQVISYRKAYVSVLNIYIVLKNHLRRVLSKHLDVFQLAVLGSNMKDILDSESFKKLKPTITYLKDLFKAAGLIDLFKTELLIAFEKLLRQCVRTKIKTEINIILSQIWGEINDNIEEIMIEEVNFIEIYKDHFSIFLFLMENKVLSKFGKKTKQTNLFAGCTPPSAVSFLSGIRISDFLQLLTSYMKKIKQSDRGDYLSNKINCYKLTEGIIKLVQTLSYLVANSSVSLSEYAKVEEYFKEFITFCKNLNWARGRLYVLSC